MRSPFHLVLLSAIIVLATSASDAADASKRAQLRGAQIADATSGYTLLDGPQIKRLFSDISNAQFPEVGSGWGGGDWRLSFRNNGTWEDSSRGVWGSWHVKNDTLCISVDGGDTQWNSVFEGCLGVSINRDDGNIAGLFPDLDKDRYILKESAFGDIAQFELPKTNAKQQLMPKGVVPRTSVTKHRDQKQALEIQRLALERERLALERQRLDQERQALLLKQQQPAADQTTPIIQTTETVATTEGTVRIVGVARDNGRLTRVEVGGRRADVDGGTGRFSAEVPVKLGRNKVVISATDSNGNKAERIVLVTRKRAIPDIAFGTYHAVVIGIDDYKSLPKLKTAIADARAVAETLKRDYGYTIHLLENPTRGDIIDIFDELRENLSEDDNLLIYYAGHGWLDKQSGRGYWLPIDARSDRRSRWVSNTDLTDALQALLAKHVMVVADSCYSGTLTRSIKVPERNKAYLERIVGKRARVVLSSGGLEPVADSGGGKHSVFAAQFLKALRGNEGVLDGTQLFEKVRNIVVLNADQTPEYSDIRKAGHEGGDFLFVRRD